MLGTVNAMYFTTNAFLPDYLTSHGQGEWISAALTGLNIGQLPASALLLGFRQPAGAAGLALCRLRAALHARHRPASCSARGRSWSPPPR